LDIRVECIVRDLVGENCSNEDIRDSSKTTISSKTIPEEREKGKKDDTSKEGLIHPQEGEKMISTTKDIGLVKKTELFQ